MLAVGIALYFAIAWRLAPFDPDDAFISYRYAENLASGKGLNFNPGLPPVEGYSNFLWILYCAALSKIGLDVPFAAKISSTIFGAFSILIFTLILIREKTKFGPTVLSIVLFSISGPFILYAVSGMETSMFAFLLLLALLLTQSALRRQSKFHFIFVSFISFLCSLTRPEGIIIFVVITIGMWILLRKEMGQRKVLRFLAPGLILFLILFVTYHFWRIQYFGQILPTPFLSKGGGNAFQAIIRNLRNFFRKHNHYFSPLGYYYVSLYFCAVLIFLNGVRNQLKSVKLISFLIATAYIPVFMYFIDWMPGMRYFVPLIALFLINLTPAENDPNFIYENNPYFRAMAIVLILFSMYGLASINYDAERYQKTQTLCVIPLGKWIKEAMPVNSVLAVPDVGAMPYYSGLQTIDINNRSLTDVHIARKGLTHEYFLSKSPDIAAFVSFSMNEPRFDEPFFSLHTKREFTDRYRLIGKSRNDGFPERCYWVYLKSSVSVRETVLQEFPKGWKY